MIFPHTGDVYKLMNEIRQIQAKQEADIQRLIQQQKVLLLAQSSLIK